MWTSDGTADGTALVKDINPGSYGSFFPYSSRANHLTNVDGTLIFRATDGANGYELWKSDGTADGTVLVKDILPGPGNGLEGPYYSGPPVNVNGTLFFAANDGIHNTELWASDGTPAGTALVKDVHPGTASSAIFRPTNVDGTLFFGAGGSILTSDGSTSGRWSTARFGLERMGLPDKQHTVRYT